MTLSPRLSLSYLAPGQAQKHVTVNEGLGRLDTLVQAAVVSRNVASEPATPQNAQAYIVPDAAVGAAWSVFSKNSLAVFRDGYWSEIAPFVGLRVWVIDERAFIVFDGADWIETAVAAVESVPQIGVNAVSDAVNKLAVRSRSVLFDAVDLENGGDGDVQVRINKHSPADTASQIFQTGFSGRAEIGLAGDERLRFKVSEDGSNWRDAIVVDNGSAYAGFGAELPQTRVHISGEGAEDSRLTVERTGNGKGVFGAVNGLFVAAKEPYGSASVSFWCTDGSGVDRKHMELFNDGGLVVGAPSGGSLGAGSINAEAIYDDNSLLSCYVFEQAVDGEINLLSWDARVPALRRDRQVGALTSASGSARSGRKSPDLVAPRRHEAMRKFIKRIGTEYDPLTLDGYAKHWREKKHLTSMPNKDHYDFTEGMSAGEWIQRLVETVEIQAVLIEDLNRRVKGLV